MHVFCHCLSALFFVCLTFAAQVWSAESTPDSGGRRRVLVTTFPIYQIARNVAASRDAFELELLLAAEAGCPHDYALTPHEMSTLSRADVLIVNGLGMEEFLAAALRQRNSQPLIYDTSTAVSARIAMESSLHDSHADHDGSDHEHDGEHEHGHAYESKDNPHLFASPVAQAQIAAGLAGFFEKLDPDGASVYRANADNYGASMRALTADMSETVARLPNNRVIVPHGAFDYLAADIGLEIVAIMEPHGQELSAARIIELTQMARNLDAGVIAVEPQYSPRAGEALGRETGLPVVVLDSASTGPENAPLDYFATVMRRNAATLANALGEQ